MYTWLSEKEVEGQGEKIHRRKLSVTIPTGDVSREFKPQAGLLSGCHIEFIILGCNYLFMCLPLPQACNLFKGRDHALHLCIHRAGTK